MNPTSPLALGIPVICLVASVTLLLAVNISLDLELRRYTHSVVKSYTALGCGLVFIFCVAYYSASIVGTFIAGLLQR